MLDGEDLDDEDTLDPDIANDPIYQINLKVIFYYFFIIV